MRGQELYLTVGISSHLLDPLNGTGRIGSSKGNLGQRPQYCRAPFLILLAVDFVGVWGLAKRMGSASEILNLIPNLERQKRWSKNLRNGLCFLNRVLDAA